MELVEVTVEEVERLYGDSKRTDRVPHAYALDLDIAGTCELTAEGFGLLAVRAVAASAVDLICLVNQFAVRVLEKAAVANQAHQAAGGVCAAAETKYVDLVAVLKLLREVLVPLANIAR